MSEPLDPLAAGVASALKSLRARAGLQEERLAGAELALDALTGLDSVRERIAAGDPVERAIVRAVAAAAGALPPTYSIVADVSLGLGLSADLLPDSGLYSGELGSRRAALLENWDRLHEVRSAPTAGRAPTPRALRLELETEALSALAVALTDAGRQVAAGPTAQLLPAGAGTARRGGTADVDRPGHAAGSAPPRSRDPGTGQKGRETAAAAPPRLVRSQTPMLLEEFRRISIALRDALVPDAKGKGWPHDLRQGSKPWTTLSTSFGLRAILLLEGSLPHDLIPVAERLRNSEFPGGGYAARSQAGPRPESTAAVLSALHRLDGTTKLDDQLAALKNNLGDFEKTRPFILTNVLETSVQLGSDPGLTRSLTEDLLAARRPYGNVLLWPEKAEKGLVAPVPSIAHTSRAVRALAQALAAPSISPAEEDLIAEAHEAVNQAAAWLAEQQDLGNVSESIDRQLDDGVDVDSVYVRHFTAAWVVKALVSAGLPASHPSVSGAVAWVWEYYSRSVGLWRWPNGDLPIWMTLDAIDALRLAAFAIVTPGGGFDA
jgi:hypothetical protein